MFGQSDNVTIDSADNLPAIKLKFASPQPSVGAVILTKENSSGDYGDLNVRLYVS